MALPVGEYTGAVASSACATFEAVYCGDCTHPPSKHKPVLSWRGNKFPECATFEAICCGDCTHPSPDVSPDVTRAVLGGKNFTTQAQACSLDLVDLVEDPVDLSLFCARPGSTGRNDLHSSVAEGRREYSHESQERRQQTASATTRSPRWPRPVAPSPGRPTLSRPSTPSTTPPGAAAVDNVDGAARRSCLAWLYGWSALLGFLPQRPACRLAFFRCLFAAVVERAWGEGEVEAESHVYASCR